MEPQERSRQTVLIVLGSLIFILGLSSVILFFQNRLLRQQLATIDPSPTSNPEASPDPTADWETYTNTKIGYEIKAPENYFVGGFNTIAGSFEEFTGAETHLKILKDKNEVNTKNFIEIQELTSDPKTLKVLVQENYQKNTTHFQTTNKSELKTTTFNSYTGFEYTFTGKAIETYLWAGAVEETEYKIIFIENQGKKLGIFLSNKEEYNQILSTLKFTGEERVFCGGIANLPCPTEGYVCEKEGDYPDAGFWCTKNN